MTIIEDIARNPRNLRRADGARGQEAAAAARKAFARVYRAVAVSRDGACDRSDGRCDASPKGDAPGFVTVLDDETLLIPDRLGNNRVDTIGNLAGSARASGCIFIVPGLRETLAGQRPRADHHRSGAARNLRRQRQGAAQRHPGDRRGSLFPLRQGADPLRSVEPGQARRAQADFPSLGIVIAEQIGATNVEEAERATAESYRTRLY